MASLELQKQMIINKRNLNWRLKTKSYALDILTWAIWVYMMYFIVQNWEFITTRPMFEQFRLFEIMFLMTGLVFCLLFIAVSWSFISKNTKLPLSQ
ncbi:ABC transporter substrate-binding protein [Avibacterium endocarditidis]|uniref:ABC transporter substrate-binding protein n=1 Tax=Avibacterium endocarditidis TaxID=380674 RepID=UPI0039EE06F1